MSRIRRKGFRREPAGGWPLDEMFVGVATLRTLRELYRQEWDGDRPPRAWDLALWSGVSPQGSTDALERLLRTGLVRVASPASRFRARSVRLDPTHPLYAPLSALFEAERIAARRKEIQPSGHFGRPTR